MEPSGDTSRASTRGRVTGLVAFVVVAYVLVRVAGWVLSLPTIDGPDSHSYLPGAGLSIPPNGYIGFEKVSISGAGAIRPWTITLPYALLLTDYVRSLFQLFLSIGAFLLLAAALLRVVGSSILARVLALIVLVFSCTAYVASWDMLMNRESIAISLTVSLIALTLLSLTFRSYWFLLLVLFNALLLMVTRPTLAPLVVLLLLTVLVERTRHVLAGARSNGGITATVVVRGIVAAILAIIVVAYPAAYSMKLDASWQQWYGQTMSETQFGYVVSDYNPRAEALKAALSQSAPACLIAEIPVFTGTYVGAPWGFAAHLRDTCPEFATWYQQNWPNWYYRYIVGHPDYVAKVAVAGAPLALKAWDATKSFSPLPSPVRDLFFTDTTNNGGTSTYDPMVLYWSLVAAVLLFLLLRSRRSAWEFLRDHRFHVAIAVSVIVGSTLSIVTNLLLIPSYPLETNRVNVSTALALRLSAALLAVFLVWRLAVFLRAKRPSSADESGLGLVED